MPEDRDNSTLLAVGSVAVAGALGYFLWYAPRQAARRKLEAELLRRAGLKKAAGSNMLDTISTAACVGLALSLGIPPTLSSGVCKSYAGGLVRGGIGAAVGGVKGVISGAESAGKSVGGAVEDAGKNIARPFAAVGKEVASGVKAGAKAVGTALGPLAGKLENFWSNI